MLSKRVRVRLSEEDYKRLQELSAEYKMKPTELIRRAIRDGISGLESSSKMDDIKREILKELKEWMQGELKRELKEEILKGFQATLKLYLIIGVVAFLLAVLVLVVFFKQES